MVSPLIGCSVGIGSLASISTSSYRPTLLNMAPKHVLPTMTALQSSVSAMAFSPLSSSAWYSLVARSSDQTAERRDGGRTAARPSGANAAAVARAAAALTRRARRTMEDDRSVAGAGVREV